MTPDNQKLLKEEKQYRLPMTVLGGDVASDGQRFYAACMDGIYELDLKGGSDVKLDQHQSYVSSLFCVGEGLLVSAGYDGAIQWFDRQTRKRVRRVQAHQFWSWQMALSRDKKKVASVTGQYLAGDYEYKPAAETEPSIRVYDVEGGKEVASFSHVPSVQAVAFSPDDKLVAAGNLMGEVRVYDIGTGDLKANWTTPDFTSWGIIKSHCYIGGIYDLQFSPNGDSIYLAGMGYMRDPMAGNGRQLWQKFDWRSGSPKKLDETHKGESGEGLMETLAFHPSGKYFVMAGRLRGGSWNAAVFEGSTGTLVQSLKTGFRITHARFSENGKKLYLMGGQGQPKGKNGKSPPFGRIVSYQVAID